MAAVEHARETFRRRQRPRFISKRVTAFRNRITPSLDESRVVEGASDSCVVWLDGHPKPKSPWFSTLANSLGACGVGTTERQRRFSGAHGGRKTPGVRGTAGQTSPPRAQDESKLFVGRMQLSVPKLARRRQPPCLLEPELPSGGSSLRKWRKRFCGSSARMTQEFTNERVHVL